MKHILTKSHKWYLNQFDIPKTRKYQLKNLIDGIENEFNFENVICIETGASQNIDDGCIGLFFAKLCELTKGEFHSIDNNKNIVDNSKKLYSDCNLDVNHYIEDSVKFLEDTLIVPNLIHLDSWDLNLLNPFPSALHGWNEFMAIEGKMPIGSIIIIDDNYFKGTWVEWNFMKGKEYTGEKKMVSINYPIIGKGSLIYHFVENGESNWKKLSIDSIGKNEKIFYKKIR
tara:strand:+ start:329 stop:1012 length:684 start_codon:yes stop_codon:yes gene_type:complete